MNKNRTFSMVVEHYVLTCDRCIFLVNPITVPERFRSPFLREEELVLTACARNLIGTRERPVEKFAAMLDTKKPGTFLVKEKCAQRASVHAKVVRGSSVSL